MTLEGKWMWKTAILERRRASNESKEHEQAPSILIHWLFLEILHVDDVIGRREKLLFSKNHVKFHFGQLEQKFCLIGSFV